MCGPGKVHSAPPRAATLAFFHPASLQAQTLLNGSFESNGGQQSNLVPGWTLASTSGTKPGGSLFATSTEGATDGSYAIAFNANNLSTGTKTLSRSFVTVTGQTYQVKLDFGAFSAPAGQTSLSSLQVELRDGTSISSGNELITSGSGTLLGNTGGSLNQNANVIQLSDSTGVDATYGAAPNAEFSNLMRRLPFERVDALCIACAHGDGSTRLGERAGGLQTEPGVSAGDDDVFAGEIEACQDIIGGGGGGEAAAKRTLRRVHVVALVAEG